MADTDNELMQRQLQALQEEYDALLPGRLEEITQCIGEIEQGRAEPDLFVRLHQAVHRIAGSGATFGYRELGTRAREIEQLVKPWVKAAHLPEALKIRQVASLARSLPVLSIPLHVSISTPQSEVSAPHLENSERRLYLLQSDAMSVTELSVQLGYFGYQVSIFDSHAAVAEAISERRPDALLMDMPTVDGNLAETDFSQIINSKTRSHFPVLLMSERGDFTTRLAAVRGGASAFLAKPLDFDLLVEQLDRLTQRQEEPPYRVLLVDDDAALVKRHALVLNRAGMLARIVSRPEQTLEVLADLDPDIILLDLYMPGCSGLELASMIRQHERFFSIPIIYLSTETDAGRQFDALRMGCDEFLTKPISDELLVDVVATRAGRARQLAALMTQDSLTGLLKHTRIKELLAAEITRQQRQGGRLVFAMLDIDHFKGINDHHGHLVGDRVIKNLASLLKNRSRQCDLVGRYGGEEFALVLTDCSRRDAERLLNDLRERFSRIPHSTGDKHLTVTFSAGLVDWNGQGSAEELIHAADEALYQAKALGRNRVSMAAES